MECRGMGLSQFFSVEGTIRLCTPVSKTKKRMKEVEIEKGDCGPPTRKGPVVYPTNAFDFRLRGD